MNKMSGRMDVLLDQRGSAQAARKTGVEFDEVHLWISVDPLLADLHKRYLDLRANHRDIAKRHGVRDPMAIIAADMADSARCAADTRLIEIRQNQSLRAVVRAARIKAHNERVRTQAGESRSLQPVISRVRLKQQAGEGFWMLFILMLMMRGILETTRHRLSMAMEFQNATKFHRECRSGSS